MRVLLVEDSRRLQTTLGAALRRTGYAVDVTGDGQEGLWLAENNHHDVIVLDIMLPGMDGFYLIQTLREQEIRQGVQPAVAIVLTGYDDEMHRLRSFSEGFQHFLTKPADLDLLISVLQKAIERRPR